MHINYKIEDREQRTIIKYLQLKYMIPTEIHQDLLNTLREWAVSYDIMKNRVNFCEDDAGGAPTSVTTKENIEKAHDLTCKIEEWPLSK